MKERRMSQADVERMLGYPPGTLNEDRLWKEDLSKDPFLALLPKDETFAKGMK